MLVCNPANTESANVCNYFTTERTAEGFNPAYTVNLQGIPATENVNDIVANSVINQVSSNIVRIGLGKIDYIVTTVGVPLIDDGGSSPNPGWQSCSSLSIDAMLADNAIDIYPTETFPSFCNDNPLPPVNPYYSTISGLTLEGGCETPSCITSILENHPFSWSAYDMYEVTRLDGPTQQSIYNLINNANNAGEVANNGYVLLNGNAIGYNNGETGGGYFFTMGYDNNPFITGNYILGSMNVNNQYIISKFITGATGLSGYASFGTNSGNAPDSNWGFSFIPGALGVVLESYDGCSFQSDSWQETCGGQMPASNFVYNGITGIDAAVSEPTTWGFSDPGVLFAYYFSGAPLADAYYASIYEGPGWKSVIIGDPKAHVKIIPYS